MTNLIQLNESSVITSKIEVITPERAQKMIDNTDGRLQRTQSISTVAAYAESMKNGEWLLNFQPIQIGIDGNVLDGMHRLKACVKANVEFSALVIDNVPESVFDVLDRGRSRTLGDILSSRNFQNYNTVAATITRLKAMSLNSYNFVANTNGTVFGGSQKKYAVTPAIMNEFLKKNPDFSDFVSDALKVHQIGSKLLSPSSFISLWYWCSKHSKGNAATFFTSFSTGSNLPEKSPIYYIRKKLIEIKGKEVRMESSQIINMILRGFDMYCKKEQINTRFGIPKENYSLPTIVNLF